MVTNQEIMRDAARQLILPNGNPHPNRFKDETYNEGLRQICSIMKYLGVSLSW